MRVDTSSVTPEPGNIKPSKKTGKKCRKFKKFFIFNAKNTTQQPGFLKRFKDFFSGKIIKKTPAVRIEHLAPEIIKKIAENIKDVRDYAHFSQTCKKIYGDLVSLEKLHGDYERQKYEREKHVREKHGPEKDNREKCAGNCKFVRKTHLDKLFAFTEVTDFTLDILKNTTLYYVAENFYIKTRMSVNDFNKDNCKVFNRMRDALIDEPMNHELEGGPVESKKELFWKYELKLNFHEITEENIKSYFSVFHNLHNQVEGGEKFIIAHFASKVKEGLRKKLHGTINENYINKLVSLYPELFNSAAKVRYILDSSQQKLVQE